MKKRLIILGINWEQNSSACLMVDGKIISATSEERFSRKKNDERYPKKAIDYVLKINKISPDQIDHVCFISNYWSPTYSLIRHYTNFSIEDYIKEQNEYWYNRIYKNKKVSLLKIFKNKIDLKQFPGRKFWSKKINKLKIDDHSSNKQLKLIGQKIRSEVIHIHLGIDFKKINFIDHSFGHVAYAYCSGQNLHKNSYVASVDAFGDFINYSAYFFDKKRNNKIKFKKIVSKGNSIIARMYRYITLLLNMKPNEHEYKVMGLAPYCKLKYSEKLFNHFKTFQTVKKYSFFDKKRPKDSYFYFKNLFSGQRFDAIAGSLQRYTEYLMTKWIANIVDPKKSKNLCLAGGVAMNVKANLEISKLNNISNIYIPPAPDDSSQSIGACYAFCLLNDLNTFPIKSAYLGYNISKNKIISSIKKVSKSKNYKIYKNNILEIAANLLNKNKILGICRGKAEFGARSLGNRSIICNPQNRENISKINETVKNRDFWMPFAASTIDKYALKYFKIKKTNKSNYKYMTNCVDTLEERRKDIIAAIHPYDKTCRPQVLERNQNNFYYDLIKRFGKKSGIYALLNTSLNTHGNPIINNENEAIDILKKTNLDAIILGEYLIIKQK
tara:strand:+ start:372 stop:2204 length:1833 start_codon:yes stop_codon:yes gene_type:complete